MSKDFGREFVGLEVDVTNVGQVQGMVQTALGRYGQVDILVNNAGINRLEPVWEMSDETWNLVIGVNLTGTFHCTRAVLPHMIERKQGACDQPLRPAGWAPMRGRPTTARPRRGCMAFTRAVAAEVGRYGIRINAIAPGLIYNPFLERIYPPEFFQRIAQRRRWAAWASRRISPTWRRSWPATSPATSPARCSASVAACT